MICGFVLSISSYASFSESQISDLMTQCTENTQAEYGYNYELSREYCHCSISRLTAYMKKHNLKDSAPPPPSIDKESVTKAFINIPAQCAREVLAK